MIERTRLYSHPKFKKKLKMIALEKGIGLEELTKEMGEIDLNVFEELLEKKKKKGFNFDI